MKRLLGIEFGVALVVGLVLVVLVMVAVPDRDLQVPEAEAQAYTTVVERAVRQAEALERIAVALEQQNVKLDRLVQAVERQ